MRHFLFGAAALALAATSVTAEPGKGKGNGGAKSPGHPAVHAGGPPSGNAKAAKPGKNAAAQGKPKQFAGPGQRSGPASSGQKPDKYMPGNGRIAKPDKIKNGPADRLPQSKFDDARVMTRDTVRRVDGREDGFRWSSFSQMRQIQDGCPPGLAKKQNGCLPPGIAKKIGTRGYRYDDPAWYGYRSSSGSRYLSHDGYLLRLGSGGSVLGFLPLLGGALSVGEIWPTSYERVSLPPYYSRYYGLGEPASYRYYDDTIYSVDPQTSAIQSIVALLTGQDFLVGQPVPAGYEIYNVPPSYRERYYDTPQSLYRYNDGYVYQIDPETRLVLAAIELLT